MHDINFVGQLILRVNEHIHTLYNKITPPIMVFVLQCDGIIHFLAVRALVQPWWPDTNIKFNLHILVEKLQIQMLL
jgi:hypothetical protein